MEVNFHAFFAVALDVGFFLIDINPLNAELNPICHLLALSGAHHILHVSRVRVNSMLHYTVTLHALHNLSFSCTITFTFNSHKTTVEILYNFANNIFFDV